MNHDDAPARLLADLVAIPSVNPMGREGESFGEENLARYVEAFLRRLGLDVELQQVAPGRLNVIGRADAGASRTLLLEAHLDTVHVDTMTVPPFAPSTRDGRLYGRGACDTKGSMAAFLAGLERALRTGALRYNVVFAAAADEEYRFTGALHAVASGLQADFGIAGEPTRLRIVRAHKGVTRWKVTTTGSAAHSAYPERGRNAIYAMGRVLLALEQHAAELMRMPPHPLLGTPTLSVGVIRGGQAVNIVPDRCWIEVDRRTLPGDSAEGVMRQAAHCLHGIEGWEFEAPYLAAGGMEVEESGPVVRELSAAVGSVTGQPAVLEAANYATDAGIYGNAGIPTVVFGPGDIAQAHTDAEWIELKQVEQAALIIARLLSK